MQTGDQKIRRKDVHMRVLYMIAVSYMHSGQVAAWGGGVDPHRPAG